VTEKQTDSGIEVRFRPKSCAQTCGGEQLLAPIDYQQRRTISMNTVNERASGGKSWLRVVIGLGLLLPALLCCVSVLVVPTGGTVALGFFDYDGLRPPAFVGGENYGRVFQDPRFFEALRFTLTSVAVRVAVVAVVPLLLALAVNEFGRVVRVPVRLLFTIPLALFAPAVTALAWGLALDPRGRFMITLLRGLSLPPRPLLADPDTARGAVLSIEGLSIFGLACGLGLILYLAALRGRGAEAPSWKAVRKPLIASWVMGLLATLALAPQSFALGFSLTRGGPANSTLTLALYQYIMSFAMLRLGGGAALSTPGLIVAALLGLGVGLIVVLTGLRLKRVSWGKETGLITRGGRRRVVAVLLLLVMVLVAGTGCLLSVLPRAWNAVASLGMPDAYADALKGPGPISIGRAWINTVLPPLLAIFLFQMPITYVAALGIGALRPLGKRSEWLLLLFSPWLFVTMGPQSPAAFLIVRQLNLLDTVVALLLPCLFSVPILFILTLFFKGQEPGWRVALAEGQSPVKAFFSALILPSLPLAVLLACGSLLVGMQDLLWQLLVSVSPDGWTMPLVLTSLRQSSVSMPILAASVVLFGLPTFLFFFLAFGLFQALYLDRLALVAGKPAGEEVPDGPSPPEIEAMEAVVTKAPESEGAKKTVRLEPGDERATVHLEAEEERKTVRLEQEEAKKTVRLEAEDASEQKAVRERKTVRLERDADDD
jgi:ABC-type sugar transport system permease subunit